MCLCKPGALHYLLSTLAAQLSHLGFEKNNNNAWVPTFRDLDVIGTEYIFKGRLGIFSLHCIQ